jgi:hypothetical protein
LEVHATLHNYATSSGLVFKQAAVDSESMPVKDRGHYFDGLAYWELDTATKHLVLNHELTIITWIRIPVILGDQMAIFA